MPGQPHMQPNLSETQPINKVKNQKMMLVAIIGSVALAIAILWILSSLGIIPSFWATIISIISTVLGVIGAVLPFVISLHEAKTTHVLPASSIFPGTTYRGITGLPLPTNARIIQQRQKEVEEVYKQIIRPDITAIVLTGIGGAGKSTLAALIYQYAEARRHMDKSLFAAPALWLRIDPAVTMIDLMGTLFELMDRPSLAFSNISNMSPQEQATRLFHMLNSTRKPRLIILDQLENLLDWQTGYALASRPGVGEWLDAINSQQCRCRIVLTSRPWPKGTREYPPTYMQEYRVKGLSIAEGTDLLRKQGVKGTDVDLQKAVEHCEGHAFSLTLLASLARNHNLSSLSLFLDSTYSQFWKGNIARNLLDYIYKQQLNQLQRKLLASFSVYREPMPLDAACTVLDVEHEISRVQIQFAFHVLLAQHLLQASGDGYYQLHSIVASYAQDHFVEDDEQANQQALRKAHSQASFYYRQLAVLVCPSKDMRRHIRDIHALLEAIWHYCLAGQWHEAYDLIEQEDIFSALKHWGDDATLLELCQILLGSDQWQLESPQFAYIYNNLGGACWVLGQVERAQQYYNRALQICQKITDYAGEGWARNNLGRIYNTLGNSQLAQEYLEQALQIFRMVNNRYGEGECIINLGWVYYDRGDMEQARLYFEQALNIFKGEGNQREEGFAYGYIGRVYDDMGRRLLAQKYYEQSLDILIKTGDRHGEGIMLCNLGRVCNFLEYREQALEYLDLALRTLKEVGDRSGEGTALNDLGRVYADMGLKEQAQDYYEQALSLRKEVSNRRGEARTLTDLGKLCMELGQMEQAQKYFEQALQTLKEIGHGWREGRTLKNLSKVYIALGKIDQALQCYGQALSIYKRIGNRWEEGTILFEIGLLYLEQNRYDVALAFFILVQNVDEEVKDNYESRIQERLALIKNRVGEEHFTALLAEIKLRAELIAGEVLEEYCRIDD